MAVADREAYPDLDVFTAGMWECLASVVTAPAGAAR